MTAVGACKAPAADFVSGGSRMSQAPPQSPPSQQGAGADRIRLSCVDWKEYSRFLYLFADRPGYRLTYDRGELEIMSPLLFHENDGQFLGQLVITLTQELGWEVTPGGSVTIRRRKRQRGLEPDECYWIANANRVAGRRRLDLRTDPPPDLAIEIDATRSSLDRLSIYASLGVPEVWHLQENVLTFLVLLGGKYAPASNSISFPFLAPAELMPFLLQWRQGVGFNAVVSAFRTWVRQGQASPASP
jgi:Uma2 family endonuclease